MTHHKQGWACFLCMFFLSLLGGCDGGDSPETTATSPAPSSGTVVGKAQAPQATPPIPAVSDALPPHNPDARFNGKTALEYAADLQDLNPNIQLRGITHLAQFKQDALPARERVIAFIESGADEPLKVSGLSLLNHMNAPEAPGLIRQKLADPTFATRDETYAELLKGLKDVPAITDDVLREDMLRLAETAPDHATRLMTLDRLPDDVQKTLMQALFKREHNEQATIYFMGKLHEIEGIDDAARIQYVLDHPDAARRAGNETLLTLRLIGTEPAMQAAIQLAPEGPDAWVHRYQQMQAFAGAKVDPIVVIDTVLGEAQKETDGTRIATAASCMEGIPPLVYNAQPRDEAKAATVADAYYRAMGTLLKQGPTDTHKAVAIQSLIRYTQTNVNRGASGSALVETLCKVSADEQTPQIVRNTLWAELKRAGGFVKIDDGPRAADAFALAICSGQSVDTDIIARLARTTESGRPLIHALIERMDVDQKEQDADLPGTNPALVVMLELLKSSQLWRSDLQQEACPTIGRLAASPDADLAQLERALTSYTLLAHPKQNFAPGTIALLEPVIFADHPTVIHAYVEKNRHILPMLQQLFAAGDTEWAGDAEQQAKWKQFLTKVAASDDPLFSGLAKNALGS